jgi:hypothetical protein
LQGIFQFPPFQLFKQFILGHGAAGFPMGAFQSVAFHRLSSGEFRHQYIHANHVIYLLLLMKVRPMAGYS